jgi:hypothetical protein
MNSFKEEFRVPLDDVSRWYIRVPATFLLFPLVLLISISYYVILAVDSSVSEFLIPCLIGKK